MTTVEASLHAQWVKYANVVFSPSLESLSTILAALQESNAEWQEKVSRLGAADRSLDVRSVQSRMGQ